ncbi:MAG: M55 family metallopeptidase [Pseudomonadota bacterium]
MRLFMSIDLEGVAGVVHPEQTRASGRLYNEARRWMTAEASAAYRGAAEGGATSAIMADAHGDALNLDLDALPPEVEIVSSWPRPLGMMQGISEGCDAVFLIGYHTGAHHERGVLAHSFHGQAISGLEVNGAPASELVINAALAGEFGAPIALVAGDEATCAHARETLGRGVVTVATKTDHGRLSARSLTPAASCARIREAADAAMRAAPALQPLKIAPPIAVTLRLKHHWTAELLAYLPFVERLSAYEVSWTSPTMREVVGLIQFITSYRPLPP